MRRRLVSSDRAADTRPGERAHARTFRSSSNAQAVTRRAPLSQLTGTT